jgi:hypothetical protein
MAKIIIGGFLIWLTAWVGWEITVYNYNRKVRPHANEAIYTLQALWEMFKLKVGIKKKELKKEIEIEVVPIEVVLPSQRPRSWEWTTNYRSISGERKCITELIEGSSFDNNK